KLSPVDSLIPDPYPVSMISQPSVHTITPADGSAAPIHFEYTSQNGSNFQLTAQFIVTLVPQSTYKYSPSDVTIYTITPGMENPVVSFKPEASAVQKQNAVSANISPF
ncbi:MAG: hypothetical protein NWQ13_11500, partial [Glaciimonas sp.]|nr:hypothetical protein [Glaciimonas sp.]